MQKKLFLGAIPALLLVLSLTLAGCNHDSGDSIRNLTSIDSSGSLYELALNDSNGTYTLTVTDSTGAKKTSTGTFKETGSNSITLTSSKGQNISITLNGGQLSGLGGGNITYDNGETAQLPTTVKPQEKGWKDVTDINQLNGTWKGSVEETMTVAEYAEGELPEEVLTMFGDMKVTLKLELTSTFNASAKTAEQLSVLTMTFSGGNINTPGVWDMIKQSLLSQADGEFTHDDTAHSVTKTVTNPEQVISAAYLAEMMANLQISDDGKKIRMPAGMMGNNLPAMELTKQ